MQECDAKFDAAAADPAAAAQQLGSLKVGKVLLHSQLTWRPYRLPTHVDCE